MKRIFRVGDFQMDFENANQKKSIEFYILLDVGDSYRNCKRDEAIDYYPCKVRNLILLFDSI